MVIWSRRRPEKPRPRSVTWPNSYHGSRCDLLAYFNNLNNPSWNLPLSARRLTPWSKPDWIPHESPPNHFGYGDGHCSALSCILGSDHQPFILKDLDSWLLRDILGPIISIRFWPAPAPRVRHFACAASRLGDLCLWGPSPYASIPATGQTKWSAAGALAAAMPVLWRVFYPFSFGRVCWCLESGIPNSSNEHKQEHVSRDCLKPQLSEANKLQLTAKGMTTHSIRDKPWMHVAQSLGRTESDEILDNAMTNLRELRTTGTRQKELDIHGTNMKTSIARSQDTDSHDITWFIIR